MPARITILIIALFSWQSPSFARTQSSKGQTVGIPSTVQIQSSAIAGDAESQFNLGLRYTLGEGAMKDDVEGAKWLKMAADQGHAKAQFFLGMCYLEGKGVQKSTTEAFKWYRKSADQGFVEAQAELGMKYFAGLIVKQNFIEAVKWLKLAAEQNHPRSQRLLARCYSRGHGVKQDDFEAYVWISIAAENMDAPASLIWQEYTDKLSEEEFEKGQLRFKQLQKEIQAKSHKSKF